MKRNFWKKNEVKCMLQVFKDLNIVQLLEQKSLPINDVYRRVEWEMDKRGFKKKTSKQIQSKWSQMKSAYLCVKRNHKADFYKTKDPEFRDQVAELAEMSSNNGLAMEPIPVIEPVPMLETGSADEKEPMEDDDEEERDEQEQEDEIRMVEKEPEVPEEPEDEDEAVLPSQCHSLKKRVPFKLTEDEYPFKQGSYKKSFWKFMQQLKSLEVDLQEEFIMKQSRLMSQEHKLQVQRDNLIIASFAANTNLILKSTQELIEKGFHR